MQITNDGTTALGEIEIATGLLELPAQSNLRKGGPCTDGSASTSTGEAGACELSFERLFKRTPIIITNERRTLEQDRDPATVAVTRIGRDGFGIALDAENPAPAALEWIAIGTPFSEGDQGKVREAAKRSESWDAVQKDIFTHVKESEEATRLVEFLMGVERGKR